MNKATAAALAAYIALLVIVAMLVIAGYNY
jgi:hypothetical protein